MQMLSRSGVRFVRRLLSYVDTPRSLTAWLLYKSKEWDQLVNLRCDPLLYCPSADELIRHKGRCPLTADRYRRDAQASDLLRKIPFPTSFDRRKAAIQAWEDAEGKCAETNLFISALSYGALGPMEQNFAHFLRKVKNRMTRFLGRVPSSIEGRFGPGSVAEWSHRHSPTAMDKLWGDSPYCTREAEPYFRLEYDRTAWSFHRSHIGQKHLSISEGGRLTTVPKDGKTNRSISIEPLGNLWVQLGVGKFLKKRLEMWGLKGFMPPKRLSFYPTLPNDPDPQPMHKHLAKEGSTLGHLATIDLSSASDTISRKLVESILPADWFCLLNDIRSRRIRMPTPKRFLVEGGDVRSGRVTYRYLEKFSSMGNGFTFELETAIFTVLLEVGLQLQAGVDLWVFGDDIILPNEKFSDACNLLNLCGLIVNKNKSFGTGYFRESCGGDYFDGVDVRPIVISDLELESDAVVSTHNLLLGWGFPESVLNELPQSLPSRLRIFGPCELGDSVFHRGPVGTGHDPRGLFSGKLDLGGGNFLYRVIRWEISPADKIPIERWYFGKALFPYVICGSHVVRRGSIPIPYVTWAEFPGDVGGRVEYRGTPDVLWRCPEQTGNT